MNKNQRQFYGIKKMRSQGLNYLQRGKVISDIKAKDYTKDITYRTPEEIVSNKKEAVKKISFWQKIKNLFKR